MNISNLSGPKDQNQDGQNLADLEDRITRGLPSLVSLDTVALALLEIYERQLYKEYGSFKAYLEKRWHWSRSRGYQLLHFGRLKRMSTMVDTTGAINERQARLLDADGKPRKGPDPDLVQHAMGYLARTFFRLKGCDRPEFIDTIRQLLWEMEASLNQDKNGAQDS